MFFHEPLVEFVPISIDLITDGSNKCENPPEDLKKTASYTDCGGEDSDKNNCSVTGTLMVNKTTASVKAQKSPKNVVGFDMTFDK